VRSVTETSMMVSIDADAAYQQAGSNLSLHHQERHAVIWRKSATICSAVESAKVVGLL